MSYLDKASLKVVGTRPIRPDGVDKVTGRANFGADMVMPGMLWGRIKRSPHAHARIVGIDTAKAATLPGVKAVITRADFPDITPERAHIGTMPHNLRDLSRNCMAGGKVLYEGHAVAAVAATSPAIAEEALDLIEVQYEVLPYVMDVEAAMAEGAPVLHDDIFTAGVEPKPAKPSKKSGRPVKMVMSREEVFRATGPTSGAVVEVKIGAKKDGQITAAQSILKYQSGAFPGSPVQQGCICGMAVYDFPNSLTVGYDVLSNRPKVAAYRAPGAPIGSFGVESCIDELAHALKIDPLKLREINGAKEGTKAAHGPTFSNIGYQQTLEIARAGEHLKAPLG